MTGQQVVFRGQRHKFKPKPLRGRLDTKPCIRHSRRHIGRYRRVGVLLNLVTIHFGCSNACLGQQAIQQFPGSRLCLPVDKRDRPIGQCGNAINAQRVTRRHH